MPVPTEPIGSIPRPAELIAAWTDRQAGKLSDEQFARIADSALRDTIRRFEVAFEKIRARIQGTSLASERLNPA